MESNGLRIPGDASSSYEYVSPIGYSKSSRCGYCGTNGKSYSYYANATLMSPKFYQTLLDRNWRRSGMLMYRPDQRRSCCPHYTIRLNSSEYKPSRAQRQTINRFNKYITGNEYVKKAAALHPKSREEAKRRDNHFDLVERVHEAEYDRLVKPTEPAHKLQVTLESNEFTEEKFLVYQNYQAVVHKEGPSDISRKGFQRFLCSSPLRIETVHTPNGREKKLGSFHQCYRLDGQLVAIGVLDLLPDCVSSVYFLYHESIHQHAPGKLGALYEISLAIEGGYGWWYPGFYIHSCPKMRYKIDYSPQEILDPESLHWDHLDKHVLDLLDQKPFVSLSKERKEDLGPDPSLESDASVSADSDNAEPQSGKSEGDEDDTSLFAANMPGIPSLSTVAALDMDHIALKIKPNAPLYETSDLVVWHTSRVEDWPGLKAGIAELVAAIGPDLMHDICLDFSHA